MILQSLNSSKLEFPCAGNQEWDFVDEHDVNGHGKAWVLTQDVWWNLINVCSDVRERLPNCFAFQAAKIRAPHIVCTLHINFLDGTILESWNNRFHQLTTPRSHDDILKSSCLLGHLQVSFCAPISSVCNSLNESMLQWSQMHAPDLTKKMQQCQVSQVHVCTPLCAMVQTEYESHQCDEDTVHLLVESPLSCGIAVPHHSLT